MPPYLLLALLLGAIYGVLFHLWQGKRPRDLVLYLIGGALGFFLGQMAGHVTGLNFMPVGQVNLVEATLGSWAMLFLVHWLKI